MKQGLSDDRFWELVDLYEKKDITEEEVIDELCYYSKNFNVVMADYALLVGRTVTSEEKKLIKEKLNKKNAHKNK